MSFGFLRRPSIQGSPRHAYECLRSLLNRNTLLLERMSEIEAELEFTPPASPFIQRKIVRMAEETLLLAEDLNVLSQGRFKGLYRTYERIRRDVSRQLSALSSDRESIPHVLPLWNVCRSPQGLSGNKAYNLAKVMEHVPDHVPPGFVVTTEAYWRFLHEGGLFPALLPHLQELEAIRDSDLLRDRLEAVQRMIMEARVPENIERAILENARGLQPKGGWAVRSSAEGEDGRHTFAGLFESLLNVPERDLPQAYRGVIQSRFQERAFVYRQGLGLREIDTPMAVLFLVMVEARSAGVLYTRDPGEAVRECMLIQSVWGLAQDLVAGRMDADQFVLDRVSGAVVEETVPPKESRLASASSGGIRLEKVPPDKVVRSSLRGGDLKKLWAMGHALERVFGTYLDIEWAVDSAGKLWVIQARPLVLGRSVREVQVQAEPLEKPILEGGVPIQAGRVSGPRVCVRGDSLPGEIPEGSILVVAVATPQIAALLPRLGGCISETGNPAGHAASLLREWRVPSLFGVKDALERLERHELIGLDAAQRKIYAGLPWPESGGKKRHRNEAPPSVWEEDRLGKHVFPLHLVDPASSRFRAEGCTTFHDIIRFVHQKAVETLFEFGDRHVGQQKHRAIPLAADIPLNIAVLDLGGTLPEETRMRKSVIPSQIASCPFQALWRGISDPQVSWAGRQEVSFKGFTSVLVSSMAGRGSGGRKLGDRNYLLVSRDFMNLNLRLAYHYAMVDALVGESQENNFVNFRFRGGGASADRRECRARFLSEALLRSRFTVDRRGDLVTAWFRRYPRPRCEEALAMLGRLMACSRQLDMLVSSSKIAHSYAERFLAGDYEAFR